MKKYENPKIEVTAFDTENIVTVASAGKTSNEQAEGVLRSTHGVAKENIIRITF